MEKIGLNITDSFKININDVKEAVLEGLKSNNIEHSIAFDKVNKNGIKETIITMREPDIEVSLENDIVQYIKTVNTDYSQVDTLKSIGDSPASHIPAIKKNIEKKFGVDGSCIKIEAIDTSSMNMTVVIKYNDNKNTVRVHIIRDAFGNIFINTINNVW